MDLRALPEERILQLEKLYKLQFSANRASQLTGVSNYTINKYFHKFKVLQVPQYTFDELMALVITYIDLAELSADYSPVRTALDAEAEATVITETV